MNDMYKFRNTISPVISQDLYTNSQSIQIKYKGEFILLESLLNGFKTLTVTGRELLPQTMDVTDYDAGQDGQSVKSSSHKTRTIKVSYLIDTHNMNVNDFFRRLNFYLSNGPIEFRFMDDTSWFYIGYLTATSEINGVERYRTGDFTITCYDPVKHYIDTNSLGSHQFLDNRDKSGSIISNLAFKNNYGAAVLSSNVFNAKSPISSIALSGIPYDMEITIRIMHNVKVVRTSDADHDMLWEPKEGDSTYIYFKSPSEKDMHDFAPTIVSGQHKFVIYLPTYYQDFAMYAGPWYNPENFQASIDNPDGSYWSEEAIAAATSRIVCKKEANVSSLVEAESDIDNCYFLGTNNAVLVTGQGRGNVNKWLCHLCVTYDEVAY